MLLNEANNLGCNCVSILPRAKESEWIECTRSEKVEVINNRNHLTKFMTEYFSNNKFNRIIKRSKEKSSYIPETILNIMNKLLIGSDSVGS